MTKKVQKQATDLDPSAMSIDAARNKIFALLPDFDETETLATASSRGRIAADTIVAPNPVPAFRNSAMDGYAFKHEDQLTTLKIIDKSLAGHPSRNQLTSGECVRITTGARLPDDADTVVQQENVSVSEQNLVIEKLPEKGFHVRQIGSDLNAGASLITSGTHLSPASLAVLTSHGISSISVKKKLKVAVFSTGDELVDAKPNVNAAQIIDANRCLLSNMLSNEHTDVFDLGIVADNLESLATKFNEAASSADIVLSSGGASVGDADYIKTVLEEHGKMHMWKVAMKPGRPLVFGLLQSNTPYFGLPGNPVSAAVTCLQFVKPSIRYMLGQAQAQLPHLSATLLSDTKKLPGRTEFQRGVLSIDEKGTCSVDSTGVQDSHMISSLQHANCFIELDSDSDGAKAGEQVNVLPFSLFSDLPVL